MITLNNKHACYLIIHKTKNMDRSETKPLNKIMKVLQKKKKEKKNLK